jgi:uncharacterized membrane protein YkvA (DUF1232 family)
MTARPTDPRDPTPLHDEAPDPDRSTDEAPDPDRPTARLAETVRRLPSYLRLTRALLGDRRLGRLRKAGLGAGLAYLASPIDLVPGIVPLVGQLDDLAAVLLAIRFALKGLPGPAADAMLANVGLSRDLLARDLDNVRVVGGWAVRGAARTSARVAGAAAKTAGRAARASGRAAKASTRTAARLVRAGRQRLDARRAAIHGAPPVLRPDAGGDTE